MVVKFSHTIFYVPDVMQAIEFYKKAFDLKSKFIHESQAYAELDTDGVTLAFASEEIGHMNLPQGFRANTLQDKPQACEIALSTDNPQTLYNQAIEAGAISVLAPHMKPWGQEVAYVRDPFGILVEICSFM